MSVARLWWHRRKINEELFCMNTISLFVWWLLAKCTTPQRLKLLVRHNLSIFFMFFYPSFFLFYIYKLNFFILHLIIHFNMKINDYLLLQPTPFHHPHRNNLYPLFYQARERNLSKLNLLDRSVQLSYNFKPQWWNYHCQK